MNKSVELVMPVEMIFRCFEGFGGWRNTRNCTKKSYLPLLDEGQHLSRTKDDPSYVNQQNESKVVRRDGGKGINSRIDNEDWEFQNAVSFQNGCALAEAQAVSHPMAHSVHVTGYRGAASTLMKRQKQGCSTSSNHGQSSTLAAVDSEFVIPSSSMEPLNSRSTRNHSNSGPHILDPDHPVIEVDGFSPEVRHYGSDYRDASSNGDSDDRARQVEADEMLACELQQLYHESPGVDAKNSMHSSHQQGSGRNHHSILILVEVNPVFHSSDSLTSNSYRQSRSPFSQNPSLYGGTNAQGLAYARLTRLRSRVRCELPRISYKILDLEIRADTLVGDEMQTGEMLVGPSRAL